MCSVPTQPRRRAIAEAEPSDGGARQLAELTAKRVACPARHTATGPGRVAVLHREPFPARRAGRFDPSLAALAAG